MDIEDYKLRAYGTEYNQPPPPLIQSTSSYSRKDTAPSSVTPYITGFVLAVLGVGIGRAVGQQLNSEPNVETLATVLGSIPGIALIFYSVMRHHHSRPSKGQSP